MDRGAWRATVLGVAKSQTGLSTNTHTHMAHPLECKSSTVKFSLFGSLLYPQSLE